MAPSCPHRRCGSRSLSAKLRDFQSKPEEAWVSPSHHLERGGVPMGHSPPHPHPPPNPAGLVPLAASRTGRGGGTSQGGVGVDELALLPRLQGASIRQPGCWAPRSPGAGLSPAVPGPGSTELVSVAAGVRGVEPRWFGVWGTSRRCLQGHTQALGKGRVSLGSSAEEVAPDLPVSLARQNPPPPRFYPGRLTGYQRAPGATAERRKIKGDLKRK